MKHFVKIVTLALLMTASLSGCQIQGSQTSAPGSRTEAASTQGATTGSATTPATAPATAPAQTGSEETAYPYTVSGANSEAVVIAKEPRRIVSLSPTFTEVVFAIGAGDELVGRTDYCDYPSEAAAVQSVGSMIEPSVEKILELKPDVVLVSFMEEAMLAKIEQSGATVVQIESGNSIAKSYETMAELGRILNRNEETGEIVTAIKSDIQAIAQKVKGLKPVSVYYVAGFGKDGDYTAGAGTFMDELLTAAGGSNIAGDVQGWSYTAEKLLEKDPEYVIIGSMAQMAEEFKKAEPYRNLTAVKAAKVMEVDDNLISREGPRMAQGVEVLARIFHPEAFK